MRGFEECQSNAVKHCTQSVLHFLDFKCPSMLAVDLVYIEYAVQDRVLLSYVRSVLHYNNYGNIKTGLVG